MSYPILYVPAVNCQVAEDNVRKHSDADADARFEAHLGETGIVLQNLIGVPVKRRKDHYHIYAGSRRLTRTHNLIEKGVLPKDFQLPVMIVPTSKDAIEMSLSENFFALAMLGHVSRVSFDRKDYRAVCLFQAARSAYPKSWRRAAWNKHLRGGCGILRCGISVASPSRGRLVDLLARLSAQHI